jgi:hypothetical protein
VRYELDFLTEKTARFAVTAVKTTNYVALTGWALYRGRNLYPVSFDLVFYIPEDCILHIHRRENVKSYTVS